MTDSKEILQDTLDKDVENFWDVLEKIRASDSDYTKEELIGAVKRFEDRLKDSVSQSDMDPEEKEEKLFEIEIMVKELENKLESGLEDKGKSKVEKKSQVHKSEKVESQKKIDEYSDKELKSLKKEIQKLDL